jgi:hypothetical protein
MANPQYSGITVATKTYIVKSNLNYNNHLYVAGDLVEMPDVDAAPLLDLDRPVIVEKAS